MGTRERIFRYINFFETRSDWLDLPLSDYLNKWHNEHIMSEVCMECRLKSIIQFCKWCELNSIIKPNDKQLLSYLECMKEKGVSLSSVKTYFAQLRSFFCMLDRNDVYDDITRRIKLQDGSRKERKFLTKSEAKQLMNTDMSARDKAIISLMLYCGLRCIEVSELKWFDIEGNRAVIRGKGRKEKSTWIMLPKKVIECLTVHKETSNEPLENDFVFKSLRRNADGIAPGLTPEAISHCVGNILKKVFIGKQGISAHCLRHTAITLAIESGMEMHRVSRFARHTSTSTTMIYVHDSKRFSDPAEARIESMIEGGDVDYDAKAEDALKRLIARLLKD